MLPGPDQALIYNMRNIRSRRQWLRRHAVNVHAQLAREGQYICLQKHHLRRNSGADPWSHLPKAMKTILVVDDHPVLREGLLAVLQCDPRLSVAGQAGTAAEALKFLEKQQADLVITDLGLPGEDGTELIKHILTLYPSLPVLVLSVYDETFYAERVLAFGAKGYVMKNECSERVLEAISKVLAGEVYVSKRVSEMILRRVSGIKVTGGSLHINKLTSREFSVFQLIGRGKSCRDIAQTLTLSLKTVNVYRGHIKRKLDLKSSAQLIRCAARYAATDN